MESYIEGKHGEGIHYIRFGEGDSLILLPSLWVTSKSYISLGLQLAKVYKVYIPDFYKVKSVFTYEAKNILDYGESLEYFIEKVKIKNFYLVGISLSGLIAVKYIQNCKQLPRKMFLISTTVLPLKIKYKTLKLIYGYFVLLLHNMVSVRGLMTNFLWFIDSADYLLRDTKQFIREGLIATTDYRDEVSELAIPTKLLFAKKDEFIPYRIVESMRKVRNLTIEVVNEYHGWFFYREEELANKFFDYFNRN